MTDIQVLYDGPIVKRQDAISNGDKFYFTGRPCKNGHIDRRYACNGGGCVKCISDRSKCWVSENKDRNNEVKSKYYEDNKEHILEYKKQWRIDNLERKKKADAEWQRNNKEKVAERNRKWQIKNKDKFRAYTAKRRAKERETGGYHDEADILEHLLMQGWMCASCKCDLRKAGYEVDHIIPVSKGGSSWPDNIQCLCRSCNRSKGNKLPEDWR